MPNLRPPLYWVHYGSENKPLFCVLGALWLREQASILCTGCIMAQRTGLYSVYWVHYGSENRPLFCVLDALWLREQASILCTGCIMAQRTGLYSVSCIGTSPFPHFVFDLGVITAVSLAAQYKQ